MSTDTSRVREKAVAKRQRDARHMARLLKEYSTKLSAIVDRLHLVLPHFAGSAGIAANSPDVETLLGRRAVIAGVLERVVRMASGMIEQYGLDSLDYAELVLRLRETEHALDTARKAAEMVVGRVPKLFPKGPPADMAFEWPPVPEKAIGPKVGAQKPVA